MSETALRNDDQTGYEHITVHPLAAALGAEIRGVDLSKPLDDAVFDEIHRAWLECHVIYFRNQDLTPDHHLAFAKRFGGIHLHPFNKPLDDHPEIIEILKTETETRNNGGRWHSDQMYTPKPAKGTMLYAREMPPYGGDTQFANLHLGYDALSDGMKTMLAGLKGVNNGDSKINHPTGLSRMERDAAGIGTLPQAHRDDVQTISVHPIVRTHPETGRKGLYFGSHTERFEGMTVEESRPILRFLTAHASRPEFTGRVRWEVGTLTMWDNRSCQHFAINDYDGFRRCVHKITIRGDVPF
ncbi:MAG: TauD/TfdA family dioxygenase [Alphaproteobacteria bacterium]|nr:TauD/TfdA family dioxygenase [Alphaproteobacteria bacterium]